MMIRTFSLAILLMGCSSVTNNTDNTSNNKNNTTSKTELSPLENSLNIWKALRQSKGSHYQYDVVFTSWTGFGYKTTLTVRDDEVTKRAYKSWKTQLDADEEWQEEAGSLGSHNKGAPLKTIEDLYQQCKNDVLSKSEISNRITLKYDKLGVLKQCTYSPKNCADDCSNGVKISNLNFK